MATLALTAAVRHVRDFAVGDAASERSDRELLHAYLSGETDAFARLVKRHGSLVLAVCRRILQAHDADDAFQATFLLLARRAHSLRKYSSLGAWLHGVAHRMAKNARRAAVRRRRHEGRVEPAASKPASWEVAWREVQTILDEEIQRLPSAYRDPFVLCCLENLSRAEAAQRLSLNEGTVWSRLSGARKLLRERLGRRGVTLSAALAAAAIAKPTVAAIPASLMDSTLETAQSGCRSIALVSPNVAALVKGANGMFMAKVKVLGLAVVITGVMGVGLGSAANGPDRAAVDEAIATGKEKVKANSATEQEMKFAEGWKKVVQDTRSIQGGAKPDVGRWKMMVQKGWLLVSRETSAGELEWQVVLARAVDGPLPQAKTDKFGAIEVKYGNYFVREINGRLRVLRERKTSESPEWPQLQFAAKDTLMSAGANWPNLNGWLSGNWCWVASGLSAEKPDIWVRVQHKDLSGRGYGCGSLGNQVVDMFYGEQTLQDDGELLIANRAPIEVVEHALHRLKIKNGLSKGPAPSLDSQKWFNADGELKLELLKGKVVLLDFWATWCGPCVAKLPETEKLHQKFKDRGLVVIGVHTSTGGEKLAEFLKEKKITFPIAHDTGETLDRYGVEAVPTYFLIDKSGRVVWGFEHLPPDEKQIEELLK